MEATIVTHLKPMRWERAKTAITVKTRCIFQVATPGLGESTFIVGDNDLLPCVSITACMNSLALRIPPSNRLSIWETAVVDQADVCVDAAIDCWGAAG